MELLEDVEHWPVVIVQQSARDVDAEVGCNADEVLVERAVVHGAQTEAVRHYRLARLRVGNDVRRIEQPHFVEPADGAAIVVRGED
jgi:hypothetical protein